MKKHYFCLALLASALNGMEAPLGPIGSPPSSPKSHSAPNSPGPIRYNREALLALSKSSLARSMDEEIGKAEIKVREESSKPKPKIKLDFKKPAAAEQKKPADPKKPFASCRKRYAKK